jgi:uncharacterized membrane protein YbhN (UPF0104 family)
VLVIAGGAASSRPLLRVALRLLPRRLRERLGPPLTRAQELLLALYSRPGVLARMVGISILIQVCVCTSVACAGLAFGVRAAPGLYFAVVPVALAVTALPISINGLGVQDTVLQLLLGGLGVPASAALLLSIYLHALRNGVGLAGGLLFALTRRRGGPTIPDPVGEARP